jgi:hypothetical protein
MQLLIQVQLMMLFVFLPLVANADLVRCTSPDGMSSTIQRGKCESPSDIHLVFAYFFIILTILFYKSYLII